MSRIHGLIVCLAAGSMFLFTSPVHADRTWGWGPNNNQKSDETPHIAGGDSWDNANVKHEDHDHGQSDNGDSSNRGDNDDHHTRAAVPEIDPSGVAAMAGLVIGGLALITARRRNTAKA